MYLLLVVFVVCILALSIRLSLPECTEFMTEVSRPPDIFLSGWRLHSQFRFWLLHRSFVRPNSVLRTEFMIYKLFSVIKSITIFSSVPSGPSPRPSFFFCCSAGFSYELVATGNAHILDVVDDGRSCLGLY